MCLQLCCNSKSDSALKVVEKIEDSGGVAYFSKGDVSVVDDARKITDKTVERYGKLDILLESLDDVLIEEGIDTTKTLMLK